MIQPQGHTNGQRGVIGDQHGLARLTSTLDALTKGQSAQQQRDTQLQAQLATLTTKSQRLLLAVLGLGVLTLGLCGLAGWHMSHQPPMEYARALGSIDTVLVQHWPVLPKGSQEALVDTYRRLGLLSPGQRK